jgi:hypothetical protein
MISMVIFLEVLMEFLVVFVKNQQTKVQSQGLQDRDHQSHEYCAIDKQIRRHNVYTRMRGARFSAQLYLSS